MAVHITYCADSNVKSNADVELVAKWTTKSPVFDRNNDNGGVIANVSYCFVILFFKG